MADDDIRNLMEELNKAPLKNVPSSSAQPDREIDGLRRKLARRPRTAPVGATTPDAEPTVARKFAAPPSPTRPITSTRTRDFGPPVTLEEVVDGIVQPAPMGPGYYHVEMPAEELEAGAAFVYRRFVPLTGHPDGEAVERLARVCKDQRVRPEEIVFLDLETTGLSMTPVFLIGTMESGPDGFVFRQYFARDYSEEPSILSAFAHRLQSVRMVVTFNGKCFDMPFLANRAIAHGMTIPTPDFHLDLLHEARRVYRKDLPNCRLQTLEQHVCGRERDDDIPGSEIPSAYHEYVRTGNANKIGSILMHNLYDIFTMADLMSRMWRSE